MSSNDRLLKAVQLAARKLASIGSNFDDLLQDVLSICVEAVGSSGGTIYLHDKATATLVFQHVLPAELEATLPIKNIPDDFGVAGRVFQSRQAEISVFEAGGDPSRREIEKKVGVTVRNMMSVPLMVEGEEPIGVVQLVNKLDGDFTESDVAVMDTVSAVSTLAYLNSLLLAEQTRASQLLGMGKVGHDIKNMAASEKAIMYFLDFEVDSLAEDLQNVESIEQATERVEELRKLVRDLHENNSRILGYSTLISDLSAGKALSPTFVESQLSATIADGVAYLESEARRKGVELCLHLQSDAPDVAHDPMFMARIVQNLVGNAIKAVNETASASQLRQMAAAEESGEEFGEPLGQVRIAYKFEADRHVIDVQDTGPGMPPEVVQRILAGSARSSWTNNSGSGWGTKIVLELTVAQGGVFEVESELGRGSIFRVAFPHKHAPAE